MINIVGIIQILDLLEQNSLGILQKDLPALLNLSEATISRRLVELEKLKLIMRTPQERSNLVTLTHNKFF